MSKFNIKEYQQQITEDVIATLATTGSWKKSFNFGSGLPVSVSTGKAYKGINIIILAMQCYGSNVWGTFNAWKKKGVFVNKGEKSTKIVHWSPVYKEDEETGERKIAYMSRRVYSVFNLEQTNAENKQEVNEEFKSVLTGDLLDFFKFDNAPSLSTGKPSYNPMTDTIKLCNFKTDNDAVSVAAHEMVHSTGHESRLNREGVTNFDYFGSHQYSYEELIAELGSMFICAELGMDDQSVKENQKAYIKGWLKKLKDNPEWIMQAAQEASKATEYIINAINDVQEKKEVA